MSGMVSTHGDGLMRALEALTLDGDRVAYRAWSVERRRIEADELAYGPGVVEKMFHVWYLGKQIDAALLLQAMRLQ